MRYIAVRWHHEFSDEPIDLYSEIGDDGMETRKIELFRDGRIGYADSSGKTGETQLGIEPIPPIEEIASDPQFTPREISRDEFETLWTSRKEPKIT